MVLETRRNTNIHFTEDETDCSPDMPEVTKLECGPARSIMTPFQLFYLVAPEAHPTFLSRTDPVVPNTVLRLTHENGSFRGTLLNFY